MYEKMDKTEGRRDYILLFAERSEQKSSLLGGILNCKAL